MITVAGCNLSDSLTRMAMDNPAEGGQGTAVAAGLTELAKDKAYNAMGNPADGNNNKTLDELLKEYDHQINIQSDFTIRSIIQGLKKDSNVSDDPENSRQVLKQHIRQAIAMVKSDVERAKILLKALQKQMDEDYADAYQLQTKKMEIFQATIDCHDKKVGKKTKTRTINQLQGECERLIDASHISPLLQTALRNEARVAHVDLRGISDQALEQTMKRKQKQALKESIAAAEKSRDSAQQLKDEAEATIKAKEILAKHIAIIQMTINQST